MSITKLQELFKSVESGDYVEEKLFEELQNGFNNKAYNILQIVENLGVLLVNKETSLRKKGTEILSKCLGMLEKDSFTTKELEFLVAFYCDRLKDHHSIIPEILLGLYHFCDMKHIPQDAYIKLFPVVFHEFSCQSQMIHERKMFYDILHKCMQHNIEGLKPMGPDFVCGVIQSIDGERDPRNLMFLFTFLIPLFFCYFDLYHLSEEMFDIMACYFPVDFRPRENDPDAISRDDLSLALMPNLTAKPAFVEFCIPLALEKLESDLKVAKLDSLALLTNACYKFSEDRIRENLKNIWNVIKNDLNSTDTEVKQKVVQLLHALLTVLSDDNAKVVFQSVYDYLKYSFTTNLDKALFISNAKLLTTISKDSKVCMQELAVLLVPLLFSEINKTYSDEYIGVLNEILEICTHNLDIDLSKIRDLSICWSDLLDLFLKLCPSSSQSLQGMTILDASLDSNQRQRLYKIFYDALQSDITPELEVSLCTFAKHYKEEFNAHVIVPLQTAILERSQGNTHPNVNNIENQVLENLKENDSTVYTKDEGENGFMKPVAYRTDENNDEVPMYLSICPPHVIPTEEKYIKNLFCPLISLDTYLKILSRDVIKFCLLEDPNESSCFQFSRSDPIVNMGYLKHILEKYKNKLGVLDYFENEFQIVDKVIEIFFNITGNDDNLGEFVLDSIAVLNIMLNVQKNTSIIEEKLLKLLERFSDTSNVMSHIILIPLMNILDFKHLETNQNVAPRIGVLSNRLFVLASTTKDAFLNKHLSILLSIIMNNVDDPDISRFNLNVDSFRTKLAALPFTDNVSSLHAYLTKSLLMKGYKNIELWLDILINNLNNLQTGKHVIESIKLIGKQETKTEDGFEFKNVKFLYRQRLFIFCLEKIMENVTNFNESERTNSIETKVNKLNNYLAILVQLNSLPRQILLSHIKTLLPIVIECLVLICNALLGKPDEMDTSESNDIENKSQDKEASDINSQLTTYFTHFNFDNALQTLLDLFKEFLRSKLELLEDYVNSFVERFLFVARHHSRLNHRITALECLYYLSFFSVIKLVPFKNKVIAELKCCLDDRKRLVRKQAVVTIDRWYILDSENDK